MAGFRGVLLTGEFRRVMGQGGERLGGRGALACPWPRQGRGCLLRLSPNQAQASLRPCRRRMKCLPPAS